jgi:hypothetical protein
MSRAKILKRKNGKLVLKFKPPKIMDKTVEVIAKSVSKVQTVHQEHEVIKHVIRGKSYEAIGQDLGISATDAFETTKAAIKRWVTDLAIDAPEAKALDLQRLDGLLVILWQQAEPSEVIDGTTGSKVLVPGNLGAAKLILDVIRMRADIYGYSAAQKMEVEKKVEHLHRLYIGASPDDL